VVITIDPKKYCCKTETGEELPKPVLIPQSIYPAAARAVRATGEVFVNVQIDKDGHVISAKARSGHPLLQRAAEMAAKNAVFESSQSDTVRTAVIIYVFLDKTDPKPGTVKYSNPFRIEVVNTTEVLNTVSY
jgi:TonB family protein